MYSYKLLPFNTKSTNPIQKHLHIESYACTLYTFAMVLLLAANFLISSEICSNQKLSNYVKFLACTYKAINEYLLIYAHQDLLCTILYFR